MNIKNVPFGNSNFQIVNFTDGRETPQRRYKHCLLQLSQKLNALKESEFKRKRYHIDILEIKENLETAESFKKQRLEIDLEEKEYCLNVEIKLIEDCMIEIAVYEQILNSLPEFTREEFEQAEQEYWEKRLINDARREVIAFGSVSIQTIKSLEDIGMIVGKNKAGQIIYVRDNNFQEKNNDFQELSANVI